MLVAGVDRLEKAPQYPVTDAVGEFEARRSRVAVVKASPYAGVGDVASEIAGAHVCPRDGPVVGSAVGGAVEGQVDAWCAEHEGVHVRFGAG